MCYGLDAVHPSRILSESLVLNVKRGGGSLQTWNLWAAEVVHAHKHDGLNFIPSTHVKSQCGGVCLFSTEEVQTSESLQLTLPLQMCKPQRSVSKNKADGSWRWHPKLTSDCHTQMHRHTHIQHTKEMNLYSKWLGHWECSPPFKGSSHQLH